MAGLFYGLSVHFKIYPIIYAIPLYLYIDSNFDLIKQGKKWEAFKLSLFSINKLKFALISASVAIGLQYLFYKIYGYECLYESLLYHLERKDHRHNFSVYYHMIYQLFEDKQSSILAFATFVPQFGLLLLTGLTIYYDLFLCLFIQTTVFVMYNKVITTQYFLWYLTIVPFALVNNKLTGMKWKRGVLLALGFVAFELFWLWPAYYFEFEGQHKFAAIQFGSYCWFWYHVIALQ